MKTRACSLFMITLAILTGMSTLLSPLHSEASNICFNAMFNSKDSMLIKMHTRTKPDRIRIFTDVTHEILFFSASGAQGKMFQLFMFDMDGKLVRQAQVLSTQTTLLTGLEKGNYLLEVFSNDERIGSGSLTKK
jgi:hypothetical protein